MKVVQLLFRLIYAIVALLFLCCGMSLIVVATLELWHGINPASGLASLERFDSILECVALLTIAVASLELGQTVLEEEVVRNAQMSAPTRIRRFLSRFLVVVVVSLAIECLVAVFQLSHRDPSQLPAAAYIGVAAGVILAAWGVFVRLNRSVEELEPEALREAKAEDHKVG
ncbi:MAG: hypothetical protein IPF53_19455 [Blastocatellia bacterium]|jgi:hypothetical protein|nr:hypothetical protein [Blastocatellia bacterium]MBK6425525.1 hypothetical protein [Blastocatellia bacterium]